MIYLDYNATTPVAPSVLEAMLPYFTLNYGNAASLTHYYGLQAADAVAHARKQLAMLINASDEELYFTSGSTEGLNLALKGLFTKYASKGNHIITYATEHKAVLDVCQFLEKQGASVTYLPVSFAGEIDLIALEKAITPQTIAICAMYANNEMGIINPVAAIGAIANKHNLVYVCDATQALGKLPVDVLRDNIHVMVGSAHKVYGPKGVGFIYLRRRNPRVVLDAQLHGGGHEGGVRSGTLNVPGIVGLGAAAQFAHEVLLPTVDGIITKRNALANALLSIENVTLNGNLTNSLPNTLNICIKGLKADKLITQMPQLAFATGSACTSALPTPSHVLLAMGLTDDDARSSIRLSIGHFTTVEEVETAANLITEKVQRLRGN